MNRSIVYVGVFLFLGGLGLLLFPWLTSGKEVVDLFVQIGFIVVPSGLAISLWGGLSPDPELSTVAGSLGNPDENILRRQPSVQVPVGAARYRPSSGDSTNCRHCYTSIPRKGLICPRCGRRRECVNCHKPLFWLAGAVRCAPCVRDEVYCDCPVTIRHASSVRGTYARRI